MAKNAGQKLKILYLMQFLLERTDEKHSVTMNDIINHLSNCGISAERKSIYDDLKTLQTYGLDIVTLRRKTTSYYIANRQFELPELKLLVDAIQGSKFITHKKSNDLIKKVESFASVYEAQLLQRQVYVANRIKTMNESIYYNIDTLHESISLNREISFLYYEWSVDFTKSQKIVQRLRKNGERYKVSPWALTWDDENYYLLAYDNESGVIKHFRVDKMKDIKIADTTRKGKEIFENFDMAIYSKKIFGMFSGEEEMVQLICENSLIGVIIDRFGKDIYISPVDEEHFKTVVKVMVSPQFIGWLSSFGGQIRVEAPSAVQEKVKEHLQDALNQYA